MKNPVAAVYAVSANAADAASLARDRRKVVEGVSPKTAR
jgi:hypothetical protein